MRTSGRHLLVGAAAMIAAFAAVPALADVKAGVDAWQRGDFVQAMKEWRPLADKGDPDAQFNMGQAYKLGRGAPADLNIARSWYQKAAAQGHEQAQANLGLILFQSGNRAAAMPWIRKAADRGDPRAQYVLGTALFNGDIAGKDWPRAYALMTRAAAQGLPQAATSLAQMNQHLSLGDRQKGVALARGMETSGKALASAGPREVSVPAIAQPPVSTRQPAARANVPAPSAPAAPAAPAAGGRWRVQLGAYANAAAAQAQWAVMSRKIPALASLRPSYEQAGAFTRLRVGPLGSRAAAGQLCAAAKAGGQACFPVAP